MKHFNIIIISLIIILFVTGCSTFKVYESGIKKELKGIPFFSHKEIVTQTTLISRSWINLNVLLKVYIDDEEITKHKRSFNYKVNISTSNQSKFKRDILQTEYELNNKTLDIKDLNNILKNHLRASNQLISNIDYIKESSIDNYTSKHLLESYISNYYNTNVVVDYSKKYYLNTKIYPFSNTNSNITIAANGTLTSASNNVDTTKLAEMIPLSEFLTDKLNIGESEPMSIIEDDETLNMFMLNKKQRKDLLKPKKISFKLSFSTEIKGFLYTLTQEYDGQGCENNNKKCASPIIRTTCVEKSCSRLKMNDKGISIVRSVLDSKAEKKDDKSFKIKGSITPPKNK